MIDDFKVSFDPDAKDLQKKLLTLSKELQGKALRSGVVYAIKPLKDRMKLNLPSDTGRMRSTIGHASLNRGQLGALNKLDGDNGSFALVVGSTRKALSPAGFKKWSYNWLGHILEEGTKAHDIKPWKGRLAKGKRSAVRWGSSYFARVRHPGSRAFNWMKRAHNSTHPQVESRFYEGLERRVNKALA